MNVNRDYGTTLDEIAEDIFRISIPLPPSEVPGGFTFNQFLLRDDAPLLFHTGPRSMFALVKEAIEKVLPARDLRYIAFSHVEADECGSMNRFLEEAPEAELVCSRVAAMTSVSDLALRPPVALADGQTLALGRHTVRWLDAPHVPHNWETGYLYDDTSATLFCGDLFTHGGHRLPPLTRSDLVEPSERMRAETVTEGWHDPYSLGRDTVGTLERLAQLPASTLACMHGSSWTGNPAEAQAMLRELGIRLMS